MRFIGTWLSSAVLQHPLAPELLHLDVLELPGPTPPRDSERGGRIGVQDHPPLSPGVCSQARYTERFGRGLIEDVQLGRRRAECDQSKCSARSCAQNIDVTQQERPGRIGTPGINFDAPRGSDCTNFGQKPRLNWPLPSQKAVPSTDSDEHRCNLRSATHLSCFWAPRDTRASLGARSTDTTKKCDGGGGSRGASKEASLPLDACPLTPPPLAVAWKPTNSDGTSSGGS